jgi:hypothetical protein
MIITRVLLTQENEVDEDDTLQSIVGVHIGPFLFNFASKVIQSVIFRWFIPVVCELQYLNWQGG